MKAAPAKIVDKKASKGKRPIQQTLLSPGEEQRMENLVLRFQEVVVARNKRLGERSRANVGEGDIMRAGLLALEKLSDEDFRALLIKAKDRE
jgi:hypothetical protein